MSQFDRIHNRLRSEAATGPFYDVSYSSGDLTVSTTEVSPGSVQAWPELSTFDTPIRNRREDRLERTRWMWRLKVSFQSEVNLEGFEDRMCEQIPIILRDEANNLQQVRLLLQGTEQNRPPQQGSSEPHEVVFTFAAVQTPN